MKGSSFFAISMSFMIIIGLLFVSRMCVRFNGFDLKYDKSPDEVLAKLGSISIVKLNDNYTVEYESEIDDVNTKIEYTGRISLDLVKTAVNAAVDNRFMRIKVRTDCINGIKRSYFNKLQYDVLKCDIYGDYITTMEVFDKSMYLKEMIPKYEIYHKSKYRNRLGYATLIQR